MESKWLITLTDGSFANPFGHFSLIFFFFLHVSRFCFLRLFFSFTWRFYFSNTRLFPGFVLSVISFVFFFFVFPSIFYFILYISSFSFNFRFLGLKRKTYVSTFVRPWVLHELVLASKLASPTSLDGEVCIDWTLFTLVQRKSKSNNQEKNLLTNTRQTGRCVIHFYCFAGYLKPENRL